MKRMISALVCLLLAISLCGCRSGANTVLFYYLRNEQQSGTADSIMAAQSREITGNRGLNYSLRLYLEGPSVEHLTSPFPEGTQLLSTKLENDILYVYLGSEFASLEDIDMTLACACLFKTCCELSSVTQVCICYDVNGSNVSSLWTQDSFTWLDDSYNETTDP